MSNILTDLKGENNFAFGALYKDYFGKVRRFIVQNSGNEADAEDVFQDAMLVLVEKLRQDNFQLTASIGTYVMAICKNIWFKKLRKSNWELDTKLMQEQAFFIEIHEAIENEKTYWDKLQGYMKKISDHCNRLIHDIFFNQKSIEHIQQEYGYTNKHNAVNQKHKCINQIKKVKEQEKT